MSDLGDLYQEIILDHGRRPRNHRELEGSDLVADGHNPLCGDRIRLYIKWGGADGQQIEDMSFVGEGCAISQASTSLMTQQIKGKSRADFEALFSDFHQMVVSDPTTPADFEGLGKLAALGGVREFPSRVKCATLAWHTLKQALEGKNSPAKTE